MRSLIAAVVLTGCGSDELATQKQPLSAADFPLSLKQAEAAIEAHDGNGCLRMSSFVECRGCPPRYRLDPIVDAAVVGPCGRSTFVAGRVVTEQNDQTYSWTCTSGPLGGTWTSGAAAGVGALVCRE
jgi:hypothetical protein